MIRCLLRSRSLKTLYAEGRRVLPDRVPIGHLGANEKKLVFEDGKPDRRLYEIATLTHLRDRLRSGISGSKAAVRFGQSTNI